MIERLEEWAAVNSYSYNREGLEKMVALAEQACAPLKADKIERLPTGLSLVKRADAPFRVFLGGHLDTVFPPDHPFQAVEREGSHLRGPGVADMKGGILVLIEALLRFERSAHASKLGWEIFFNLDEEIGSPNSTPFLRACAERCDCALLFEPPLPDGALVSGRKGSSNYKALSFGKAAHAGRAAHEGRSALYPLARFIAAIEKLNSPDTLVNVGTIAGGKAPNIIPDLGEATLNVRSDHSLDGELQALAKEHGITLEKTSFRPPKPFDAKAERLFELARTLDPTLVWRATGGVCDGNTFGAAGVPTIDTLGVEGGGLHTDEEFILIESLEKKAHLAAKLLEELAKRGEI